MIPILLNARLTLDGSGYVRKLQLEFAGNKGKTQRHACDCVEIFPGMTRPEIAAALRDFAERVEDHREAGALPH